MIPVLLKLSNFTSYGENVPELNFTKFHMAAISGQNGAGKSSLLDAITWCVWGWSKTGDSADNLIRLGQDSMLVEFTFELDGHQFLIKRGRSKKGGGSTALEFWSNSHNLTEGTIKVTQQKIIDTLHLSFDTFINSSFIRQGHADEFTTKGPTDRKRILADILGLAHYDILEEKAKEKVKEMATKIQLLDYQLLEIEAELSQKEEGEKQLSEIENQAREKETQLKEAESLVKTIEKEHQIISESIKTLEERRLQLEGVKKELADLKVQIDLKEKAKEEFRNLLEQQKTIEKNYQTLKNHQEERKNLEGKRTQLIKIKDELAGVQKILLGREEKRAQAIKDLEIQIEKLQTENVTLETQNRHLSEHKDSCPTCGQAIGTDKNKEILDKNKKILKENNEEINTLKISAAKYKAAVLPEQKQVKELETQVKKLEEETKGWFDLTGKISDLEKYSDLYLKLQQAQTTIETHTEAINDLQKIYSAKEKGAKKSETDLKTLFELEENLKQIQEKLLSQNTLKQELSEQLMSLQSQVGEKRQLVSRTKQLEDDFEKKKGEKTAYQKEKEAFEQLALAFGKKGIQAIIIETAIPEIEDEANSLLGKLTEGRMKVALETQKETKTFRLRSGQTGSEKVPGIIETLDIIISDEMGERPYENYSGGEQFRINIALRLAISKLLTRRAGAKLQFLVIDEGFGTQDAQGRTRIVEVIDTIKDDFEKILVITHLEELKEEFPVRVEVSKNSQGSTFEVVGV